MVIGVTGHRPSRMPHSYGYDYNNKQWMELKNKFKKLLVEFSCTEAVTGMALGVDTVFALAVLELKEEGVDIKLHCAVPCLNHPNKWPEESKKTYAYILAKSDVIKIVTEEEYKPHLMQVRNEYIVDLSDIMIAVWDGSKSGTGNCVEYALKQKKKVYRICP